MYLICGNYGANNIGDDLILESLVDLIKPTGKAITVISANPNKTIAKYKGVDTCYPFPCGVFSLLRSLLLIPLIKTLWSYYKADYFILGGGGLFQDDSSRAIFIWGVHILLAKLFRKKIIHIGQSIGPLNSKYSKKLVRYLFKISNSSDVYVRDSVSLDFCKSNNINARLLPDLAFSKDYSTSKITKKRNKIVLLTLRSYYNFTEENISQLSNIIKSLLNSNYQIKAICFGRKDIDILREMQLRLNNPSQFEIIPNDISSKELYKLYSSSYLVIGMRLHSIIFSIITNTPFIALSYNIKVISLLYDNNLAKYCVNLNKPGDFSERKLHYLLKDIKDNYIGYKKLLLQISNKLLEQSAKYKKIFS
jgi:polysaccharide pyruvyl transferase CsaB